MFFLRGTGSRFIPLIPGRNWGTAARFLAVECATRPRDGSGGWGEELEGNVVGVAEGQTRPVRGIDDASVRNRELVEPLLPPLELRSIGTGKGHMVQPRS